MNENGDDVFYFNNVLSGLLQFSIYSVASFQSFSQVDSPLTKVCMKSTVETLVLCKLANGDSWTSLWFEYLWVFVSDFWEDFSFFCEAFFRTICKSWCSVALVWHCKNNHTLFIHPRFFKMRSWTSSELLYIKLKNNSNLEHISCFRKVVIHLLTTLIHRFLGVNK